MSVGYNPQINDYVIWENDIGHRHEGWVYFVAPEGEHKKGWKKPTRYFSLEIATKPRPQCDLTKFFHKRIHVCLCCYEQSWNQVKLIKKRKSKHNDTIIWTAEEGNVINDTP